MIRTFLALRHVNPGFSKPEEILTLRLSIPTAQVKEPEAVIRMHQAIMDRVAAIPGVTSVGLTSVVPMTDSGWNDPIFAADRTYDQTKIPAIRLFKFISPGLLKTMGNRLVAGRDFAWEDAYAKRPVAMVSENLARELWNEPSAALGKQIRENMNSAWREVVGVVGDERDAGMDKKAPAAVYWPILMDRFEGDDIQVRRTLSYMVRSPRAGSSSCTSHSSRMIAAVRISTTMSRLLTNKFISRDSSSKKATGKSGSRSAGNSVSSAISFARS